MARDDLNVAKIEAVSPFIRCYHAQQAIEKMPKAVFVVLAGKYHDISNKLITDAENSSAIKIPTMFQIVRGNLITLNFLRSTIL